MNAKFNIFHAKDQLVHRYLDNNLGCYPGKINIILKHVFSLVLSLGQQPFFQTINKREMFSEDITLRARESHPLIKNSLLTSRRYINCKIFTCNLRKYFNQFVYVSQNFNGYDVRDDCGSLMYWSISLLITLGFGASDNTVNNGSASLLNAATSLAFISELVSSVDWLLNSVRNIF